MQYLALLSVAVFSIGTAAWNCNGDTFDNYCCANGQFQGPVMTSFQSSLSSYLGGIASSISSQNDAFASQLSLDLSGITARAPSPTPAAQLAKRAITTEARPGLTCVGDSLTQYDNQGNVVTRQGNVGQATSKGAAAMATQAPFLGVAVAAGAYVYGAM